MPKRIADLRGNQGVKELKPKKCRRRGCENQFRPTNSLQRVCSPGCAIAEVKAKQVREYERAKKERRRQDRKRKEQLKTHQQLTREAQTQFNRWIRARDKGAPCIVCGPDCEDPVRTAGHYLTVGAHPELRFMSLNCHSQCRSSNNGAAIHKRNERTIMERYRANLIDRVGLGVVEWLEGPHEPLRLSRDDLREMRDFYRDWAKRLESYEKSNIQQC